MLTLSFDSTAKIATAAVCDDGRVLAVYSIDNGLTQSELLLPMAEHLLKSLGFTFDDLGLLACSVGPGSFTGVRIGTALVKGIAFGRGLPCVAISALEALAENLAGISGLIVPVMDARRDQFYTALFETRKGGDGVCRLSEDAALSLDELAKRLSAFGDRPIFLVGDGYDGTRAGLLSKGIRVENTPPLLRAQSAASVGRLAAEKYQAGAYTSDRNLLPTYLRMPQAERERLERLKAESEQKPTGKA